ncbi:HAD-like protein [Ophiobolus disseminans]|uniref:Mitochondrial import inner membrane translocase subunit TIM50 n=1 Tax=Ophiobolus disseminans TaxID=1469910 RepID=A0A6A6ZYY8_9PLEO|nr:HAD-like protein [Ophiobolus disseminans]
MLQNPRCHFTDFFTPNLILSAKRGPPLRLPYVYSRASPTAVGRRDTTLPGRSLRHHSPANMNDMNPHAMPFQPGGGSNDPRHWNRSRNENRPPPMPPFGFQGAPWNPSFPPPPPPPQFFTNNHYDRFGQAQAQAHEQPRAHFNQWAPNHGHAGPPPHRQPYGPPPVFPPQQYPPPFQQQYPTPFFQQNHPQPRQPGYPHPAHYANMQQANWHQGATNEDIQVPTQPSKKNKKSKAKAKAAANGLEELQDSTPPPPKGLKKGRYGDEKIMLPAPQPTDIYRDTASEEPTVIDPPGHVLVILDLNGTVLYRPNKNAKTMIARPYLRPFLQYLFQNFKVMVWSSAKPENVKSLVDQALDKDLRSMLVGTWARDTFGLSSKYYAQNVQVYKNLRLVWSRDQIQQRHPEYTAGERFGQHNTVLIDDSALKASAQPFNLLEIPEFEATPEQMEGDVLREVAGYLEILRHQGDVSKFINKEPFRGDGRWGYDWPAESAGGGDMESKVSLTGKTLSPPAPASAGRKGKGSRKSKSPSPAVPRSTNAVDKVLPSGQGPPPAAPVVDVAHSFSSVSLDASQQRA